MSLFYERMKLSKKPNRSILTPKVLRRARIGELYWDASIHSIPPELPYVDLVKGYILNLHEHAETGWGMVFSGPFGTGKTALASIVLMEALCRRARCLSIRANVMVDLLWSSRPAFLPNGAPLREGLENVTFLLLDDFEIHAEHATKPSAKDTTVGEILYERYARSLPTIITTNRDWDAISNVNYLKSFINDRYWPVHIEGLDWRSGKRTDSRHRGS